MKGINSSISGSTSGKRVLNLDSTNILDENKIDWKSNEIETLLLLLAAYACPTQESELGSEYVFCTATL